MFSRKQKDSKIYDKWEMSGMRYQPQRELGLWSLGFHLPSTTDQSWDVGQSLSLSCLCFLFCKMGRTAVSIPRGCYKE